MTVKKEKREKEKRSNDGITNLEKTMTDGRTLRLRTMREIKK